MNNKKQSSIDWLVEQLTEVDYGCINKTFLQINNSLAGHKLRELFEQAKAMHKEEVKDAVNSCGYQDEADYYYIESYLGDDE